MTPQDVVELTRHTVETVLLVAAPMLIAALVVGLTVSIFQAATQIQEQTLTFAPKIVAVLLALVISAPWAIKILLSFTQEVLQTLSSVGVGG
ncbi:MAG: flagellar biosynthesis protein FliQ [Desulfovermiculus sp.]